MTRKEFIDKIARDSVSSRRSSKAWGDVVLDCLADAISTEDVVAIRNLGTFEHVMRQPKVGRNASTGERIDIPARMVVKFTPCAKVFNKVAGIETEEYVCEDEQDEQEEE